MSVTIMWEYDNAKDRERYRRYAEFSRDGGTANTKYPKLFERVQAQGARAEDRPHKGRAWKDEGGKEMMQITPMGVARAQLYSLEYTLPNSEVWSARGYERPQEKG